MVLKIFPSLFADSLIYFQGFSLGNRSEIMNKGIGVIAKPGINGLQGYFPIRLMVEK
jgi:hypothetical protein